eukprot:5263758-Lingulodinium_polyedra.AAC.1
MRFEKVRIAQEEFKDREQLLMRACKLSEKDLGGLATLWDSGLYGGEKSEQSLAKLLKAPEEPSDLAKAALASLNVHLPGVEADTDIDPPRWFKGLCQARTAFAQTALVFNLGTDTERSFYILYALQNPYKVMALDIHSAREPKESFCPTPLEYIHSFCEDPEFQFSKTAPG